MKIRKAVREDARKFGSCHYHCWQETYRGIISEDYLDNMSEQKNIDRFENIWDLREESQYVLEENGEIIGIFDISKARESYASRTLSKKSASWERLWSTSHGIY